jgi:5-methylcytosine-specific restriction endonuclease McrA
VKAPEGARLDDALDMFHDAPWSCPGGKPLVSTEQLAYWLAVLEPWFREEFAPRRKPVTAPKTKVATRPKAAKVESALSSSTIPLAIRNDTLKRDGWMCQRCGRSIYGIRAALQHRRPRQMGGSKRLHTLANLVLLCGWTVDPGTCTAWVEVEDRPGATRDGWLVPMGVAPEEWPVLRFGVRCEQPGDEWLPARWHQRQIDMGVTERVA